MTTTNRNGDRLAPADTRPVVLVRYLPGVSGETTRTVHLMPLPIGSHEAAARALCGASPHVRGRADPHPPTQVRRNGPSSSSREYAWDTVRV